MYVKVMRTRGGMRPDVPGSVERRQNRLAAGAVVQTHKATAMQYAFNYTLLLKQKNKTEGESVCVFERGIDR